MVNNGSIDAVKATMEESRKKAERLVDVNTIQHTDAREIGAEWVCLQAIRELEIDKFLKNEGWSEIQINTTLAHSSPAEDNKEAPQAALEQAPHTIRPGAER